MSRVEVFVDGFNLYHGIRDCNASSTYRKILWLDLFSFLKSYILRPGDSLDSVYYFTALPKNNKDRLRRHELYCEVLKNSGVTVIYGTYKTKDIKCQLCHQTFSTFEEKETDVNIAISILRRGVENGYDKAIIFSGDSDLAPAVENAIQMFPEKEFQILFPINRNRSNRLKKVSPLNPIYQYLPCYKKHQFPKDVVMKDGRTITRPPEWD